MAPTDGGGTDVAPGLDAGAAEDCNGADDDGDGRIDEGIDLLYDPANCGACGVECVLPGASLASCVAGACTVAACVPGLGDCNDDPADGCEQSLGGSSEHCGRCGYACAEGAACTSRFCEGEDPVTIDSRGQSTCLTNTAGAAVCWGENLSAQLAHGPWEWTSPPALATLLSDVQRIALGDSGSERVEFSCALRNTGRVVCVGDNSRSQLGSGGAEPSSVDPVPVVGLVDVADICAGGAHACAITSGEVWCWGYNFRGEVGDGTTIERNTPVRVTGLPGSAAEDVACGDEHTCAIVAGSVYCWGSNANGRLGHGTDDTASSIPVLVNDIDDAQAIFAGRCHTCALRGSSGTVACWGCNDRGQLGDNSTTQRSAPAMVVGLSGVEELALGWRFSCARSTSGTVRCWGSNADGALGTGMPGDSLVPVAVFGLEDATAVSAGWAFGCALRRGETPVCWGDDHRDSLGNGGSDTSRSTPTPISPFPPPPPM